MWRSSEPKKCIPRLSHTSTLVGSFLFVFGGHDGVSRYGQVHHDPDEHSYSNTIEFMNLSTMQWEAREILGDAPKARGYHTAILYDSRILIFGGMTLQTHVPDSTNRYDGEEVFSDLWYDFSFLNLLGLLNSGTWPSYPRSRLRFQTRKKSRMAM